MTAHARRPRSSPSDPAPRRLALGFTLADRMDVLRWEAAGDGQLRLTIFTRQDGDPPEVGEFASIYPGDDRWAAWSMARQGISIRMWRAKDGRDIGHFLTMRDALRSLAGTERKRARQ